MSWLTRYYTPEEMASLNPTVIFEGKAKAVVMLRAKTEGSIQVGYILVSKNGKNNVSRHESLHEGPASTSDLGKMRRRLSEADG